MALIQVPYNNAMRLGTIWLQTAILRTQFLTKDRARLQHVHPGELSDP